MIRIITIDDRFAFFDTVTDRFVRFAAIGDECVFSDPAELIDAMHAHVEGNGNDLPRSADQLLAMAHAWCDEHARRYMVVFHLVFVGEVQRGPFTRHDAVTERGRIADAYVTKIRDIVSGEES